MRSIGARRLRRRRRADARADDGRAEQGGRADRRLHTAASWRGSCANAWTAVPSRRSSGFHLHRGDFLGELSVRRSGTRLADIVAGTDERHRARAWRRRTMDGQIDSWCHRRRARRRRRRCSRRRVRASRRRSRRRHFARRAFVLKASSTRRPRQTIARQFHEASLSNRAQPHTQIHRRRRRRHIAAATRLQRGQKGAPRPSPLLRSPLEAPTVIGRGAAGGDARCCWSVRTWRLPQRSTSRGTPEPGRRASAPRRGGRRTTSLLRSSFEEDGEAGGGRRRTARRATAAPPYVEAPTSFDS